MRDGRGSWGGVGGGRGGQGDSDCLSSLYPIGCDGLPWPP